MKGLKCSRKLWFTFFVIIIGCSSDPDPFDEARTLSPEDLAALEGMQTAIDQAFIYNDSLERSVMASPVVTDSVIHYYDGKFHMSDSLFNYYNDQYSHQNLQDDHHHDEHGMHTHGHFIISSHLPGHLIADHNQMDSLLVAHQPIHPVD